MKKTMLESWKGALFTYANRSTRLRCSHHEATPGSLSCCIPLISGLNLRIIAFLVLTMMMSGLHAEESIITGKPQTPTSKQPEVAQPHTSSQGLRVEIEGELEALYEDYEDGSHKLLYFLKTLYPL